ncbi:hypothetical protein H311_04292 [Anncaliia algerae PRA109]|nr:hypothetical protein H311_04292 [Anncaliia algerae PRA109]
MIFFYFVNIFALKEIVNFIPVKVFFHLSTKQSSMNKNEKEVLKSDFSPLMKSLTDWLDSFHCDVNVRNELKFILKDEKQINPTITTIKNFFDLSSSEFNLGERSDIPFVENSLKILQEFETVVSDEEVMKTLIKYFNDKIKPFFEEIIEKYDIDLNPVLAITNF